MTGKVLWPLSIWSLVCGLLLCLMVKYLKLPCDSTATRLGPIRLQGNPNLSNTLCDCLLLCSMCHSWLNINRSPILPPTCSHTTQGLGEVTIESVGWVTDPRGWLLLPGEEDHIKQDCFGIRHDGAPTWAGPLDSLFFPFIVSRFGRHT